MGYSGSGACGELITGHLRTLCLDCYFDIERVIDHQKSAYLREFGVYPQFKAGIHYGLLTVGEIGIIKKEIVFSGDVLNTTSRLMEACKEYNVNVLVSEFLVEKLEESNYTFELIVEKQLRGKEKLFKIYRPAKI